MILHLLTAHAQMACLPFPLTDVRLRPSRFTENMQRDSVWMMQLPVHSLLHSFRNTAGIYSGREGGYDNVAKLGGWESLDCDLRGHITGHLLSALATLYVQTSSTQVKSKADSIVNGLANVQQQYGTGYISAFGEGLIDRNIQGTPVWAPFYTLHKILQGLIDQYTMCQNETALKVAKGLGNWAYDKLRLLPEEIRGRMIRNEFGGFNEAMYNLYAITQDERHLWVARFFYHNEIIDPLKTGETDLGTIHANTFIPKLLGECRNYELFGSEDSRRAAETFFWTLVNNHAFITGEVSDHEHLFNPDEQSRHLSGYNGENCCTYNLLKLAERLFCYQPDSRIIDYYERALYNHILGQQDPKTGMVCYFTPLKTGAYRLYSTPDSSFWCCVGTGFESHAKYASSIYAKSKDTLYVNLFIPSMLEWDGMHVLQDTRFPEENKTVLTCTGSKKRYLKIRFPYWATYMKVNGKKMKIEKDGYVTVRSAKLIEVEFGMTLRQETTRDTPERSALMYGPIVLAGRLDSVAHPFSDPTKHNDYYTFDYGHYSEVSLGIVRHLGGLQFSNSDGVLLEPFFDMHHCRYVIYWKNKLQR